MNSAKTKIAYLTIDDSPSIDTKSKIDYLMSKNIPAIIYCRGEFIIQHFSSVIYAIENGYIIGNHSYSHPRFSELNIETCIEEILKTEKLIEEAYHFAKKKRAFKLLRYPFGDNGGGELRLSEYSTEANEKMEKLRTFLIKEGFQRASFEGITYDYYQRSGFDRQIDAPWTFDTKDYVALSEKSMKKHGLITLDNFLHRMDIDNPEEGFGLNYPNSSEIILMHDFAKISFLFAPMIDKLLSKQLHFKVLT